MLGAEGGKMIIYQLFLRLFANKKTPQKTDGSIEENGCGKFNDISTPILEELKSWGYTHIWLIGILEQASQTSYPELGIEGNHPSIVKGIAGSPYAIRDYYDVSPDYTYVPENRIEEFKALVKRIKSIGLGILIDFVPNHLAREYKSDKKPSQEADFGEFDNTETHFSTDNNFYYLLGEWFQSPNSVAGPNGRHYTEYPAKASGNNVFSSKPSINDWYETIKLNYGINYLRSVPDLELGEIPDTWFKMRSVLLYWAGMGINGFRCDMAELVPIEFWEWVIPQVKKVFPNLTFIAEIYDPRKYHRFITTGKFDLLYDKVGVYDLLMSVAQGKGNINDLDGLLHEYYPLKSHLLRFMENHDEVRLASAFGLGSADVGLATFKLCATLSEGSVMLFNGQEFGEAADEASGFSGADGKTTIFDYWNMPELQKWFLSFPDDSKLKSQLWFSVYEAYKSFMKLLATEEVFNKGGFYGLQYANKGNSWDYDDTKMYSFLRILGNKTILVVSNLGNGEGMRPRVKIPAEAWNSIGATGQNFLLQDMETKEYISFSRDEVINLYDKKAGVEIPLPAYTTKFYRLLSV